MKAIHNQFCTKNNGVKNVVNNANIQNESNSQLKMMILLQQQKCCQ